MEPTANNVALSDISRTPAPRPDSKLLHFLKELPAWCILTMLIILFLAVYSTSREDFIPRIIDGLVGALLTAIVAQRPKASNQTNVSTESVNTDKLEAGSMDNANIKAETIDLHSKKE